MRIKEKEDEREGGVLGVWKMYDGESEERERELERRRQTCTESIRYIHF